MNNNTTMGLLGPETPQPSCWTATTWNVNGWCNDDKRWEIGERLKHKKCAIAFIQETHSKDSSHIEGLSRRLRMHGAQSPIPIGNFGCALLSRHQLSNVHSDPNGYYLIAETAFLGRTTTVVSLHLPCGNISIAQHLESLEKQMILRTPTLDNILIGGDWNCDLKSQSIQERSKIQQITIWIDRLKLVTSDCDLSVPSRGARCIDFFACSKNLARPIIEHILHYPHSQTTRQKQFHLLKRQEKNHSNNGT